jgi:hypothetical protein
VDGYSVDGAAVGEPLDCPGRDWDPALGEFVMDFGELLVAEEPTLAYPSDEVEGVDALRRRDRVRCEDSALVTRALEEDFGDGERLVYVEDRAGDGLLDVEGSPTVGGTGMLMGLPAEGARIIRNEECTAGGGGCK